MILLELIQIEPSSVISFLVGISGLIGVFYGVKSYYKKHKPVEMADIEEVKKETMDRVKLVEADVKCKADKTYVDDRIESIYKRLDRDADNIDKKLNIIIGFYERKK